jgi:hypothetical protein
MDENSINNENIFQWEVFMYKCLNNDPPLPLIYNKDAVIGLISVNLKDITLGYRPIKRRGRPLLTQTAIISMKLAFALLDDLQGVIIWGKKNYFFFMYRFSVLFFVVFCFCIFFLMLFVLAIFSFPFFMLEGLV